tara:strand:+ start:3963 stop:5075 length:1113 start_codon:yes stop_codon:yes gene_type:complete
MPIQRAKPRFTDSKGTATADQLNIGQIGGRRNIVINGAMQISQRATSATGVGGTSGVFPCVDRMKILAGTTAGRLTMSQAADVHDGFANALKFDCTTADTSTAANEFFILRTLFEGQDVQQIKKGTSDAEKLTLSFYVKGNASATYTCELEDRDNSRYNSQEFSVTTSWTRVVKTFLADTTGSFGDDNAESLAINFWLHSGSTYTGGTHTDNVWHTTNNQRVGDNQTSIFDSTDREFFITGIQLEVGEQATPFEHRSFGEELRLCQRYFHKQGGTPYYNIATVTNFTSGAQLGTVRHPVEMRSAPSVTKSGTWAALGGDTTVNQTAVSSDSNPQASEIGFSGGSGGTSGRSSVLRFSNDANAYLHWDAEL